MGALEDSLVVVLEEIAKRIAVHVAAHMADSCKHAAPYEQPRNTRTDAMHMATNLDAATRRRGRPKKQDLSVSTEPAQPVPAQPVPAQPVPAQPVPAQPVAAQPVPAEQSISEAVFDYDTLKAAVIELANIVPDGRSKVLDIFTEHKVPGNKAQNADPWLWPVLYADVTACLEDMRKRIENRTAANDDVFAL